MLESVKHDVIAAGGRHTAVLLNNGTLVTWGANRAGQLGNSGTIDSSVPITVLERAGRPFENVVSVAAGDLHTVASREDGTVWAWGANRQGQLGNYTTANQASPVQVGMLDAQGNQLTDVVAIAAGGNHSVALRRDGTVYTWGSNVSGQLGDGSKTSRTFPAVVLEATGVPLQDIVSITAGKNFTVAVKQDGRVLAWGDNTLNQLGTHKRDSSYPRYVLNNSREPLTNVVSVSAGENHIEAVTRSGRVLSWGGRVGYGVGGWNGEIKEWWIQPVSATPYSLINDLEG